MTARRRVRRFVIAGSIGTGAALAFATVAMATTSPIVGESFTNTTTTTTSADWVLPTAQTGADLACLTASANSSQTPIPGCALATPDADGSGALRLTNAGHQ